MREVAARAWDLLQLTRKAPRMWASDRESLLQRVATLVETVDHEFVPWQFYGRHLGLHGVEYKDPHGSFDDEWARSVIDDALLIIERKEESNDAPETSDLVPR